MSIPSPSDLSREVKVLDRPELVRVPTRGGLPVPKESFAHLHIAGWTLDEVEVAGPAGVIWVVIGAHGARRIRAQGPTRTAARWAVVEQLAAGGAIDPRPVQPAMSG